MAHTPPGITLDRGLVAIGLEATRSDEVIKALGRLLQAHGYVDADYTDAVIKREHEYATGLPTAIPVALPHTDAGHCRRSALAVGTLARPVDFQEMGNPESTLSVRVVFLLALADSKEQVVWLQRFMRGLRKESFIARLTEARSEAEVVDLVREMLGLAPEAGS